MRILDFAALFAAILITNSTPASAQQRETKTTASNGVVVSINGDDFAARYEYTAPTVNIDGGGFFLVAAIKKANGTTPVMVMGSVYYDGEWRFYDQALFRGGEQVPAIFADREVISCSGSRYGSGCSHREGFQLTPTSAQLQKYGEGGIISMQLRAKGLYPTMISVPVSYFDAIREVAGMTVRSSTEATPSAGSEKKSVARAAPSRAPQKQPTEAAPRVRCVTCR